MSDFLTDIAAARSPESPEPGSTVIAPAASVIVGDGIAVEGEGLPALDRTYSPAPVEDIARIGFAPAANALPEVPAGSPSRPRKQRSYHAACRVCKSPSAAEVEKLCAMQTPATVVAGRFGFSADSVRRHFSKHVSESLRTALVAKGVFGAPDVDTADKLIELRERERDNLILRLSVVRGRLNQLSMDPDLRVSVAACNSLIRHAELVAKILGEIRTDPANVTNVLNVNSPDIMELRAIIERALKPWPQARAALLCAMAGQTALGVRPRNFAG